MHMTEEIRGSMTRRVREIWPNLNLIDLGL
jgi:hypothetical protein